MSKNEQDKKVKRKYEYITFSLLISVTILSVIYKKDLKNKFIYMIYDKAFLLSAIISILFSIYIFSLPESAENSGLRKATTEGMIAFFIAILAYLDLRVVTFWLIWISSYYFNI